MKRLLPALALSLLLLAGAAQAQRVPSLLPADTVVALGLQDLPEHADRLEVFIEEFESLGVAEAFEALAAQGTEEADDLTGDLPAEVRELFANLTPLDLLGDEAWLAVSISSFNPLPAVTLVLEPSEAGYEALGPALADLAARPEAQELVEGDYSFFLLPLEQEEGGTPVNLAIARVDGLVIVSSNPDVLRGVLRRLGGAAEPSLAETEAYAATIGALGQGNGYAYFDYGTLARSLAPLAQGMGFDSLVAALQRAFETAGVMGGVMRVSDAGVESATVQLPNPEAGDQALLSLLASPNAASRDPLAFVPPDALSVTVSHTDLTGWWNYLGSLVAAAPELGIPDLDAFLTQMLGIDLRAALFDWLGTQVATVTVGVGEPVQPGVPSANLLGETVFVLEATDETAARQGLALLFNTVSTMVAGFADPMAEGGAATLQSRVVGDVEVTSYDVAPGLAVAYAVVDGWALIATSNDAIDAALLAYADAGALGPTMQVLLELVPEGSTAYSLTDYGELLRQTAGQLASQLQSFAGLGGGELDFAAVQEAGATLEEYLAFVASRVGGSVSYQRVESGALIGYGLVTVDW